MIIKEIRSDLQEYRPGSTEVYRKNDKIEEFGGLTGAEIIEMVTTAAKVQAVEESLTCFSNQGFKGSSYRDLLSNAEDLGFNANDLDIMREYEPHLPFFIPSLGPHLVNVVITYLSTKYFKEQGRTSDIDKDVFYSYYRTSSGLGIGLGDYSALNTGYDVVKEVFKTALGFPDATNTVMPEHLTLPELGHISETSTLAAQADIAAATAMSLGPLLRSDQSVYAEDSIVHLNAGDSGINEPSFPDGYKLLRRHMYLVARHFLPKEEVQRAEGNPDKERELYQKLRDRGLALKFASYIFDNKIGISCPAEVSQSWEDPLYDYIWMERDAGLLKIFRFDSLDFTSVMQNCVELMDHARKGPVMANINVTRPGGHSLSNYYGLGKITEKAKGSPIPSLTLEEAKYHNNNDTVLNALKKLIDTGLVTVDEAVGILDDAKRTVLEKYVELIPVAKSSLPSKLLVPRWAYTPELAQTNWNILTGNKTKRDELWRNGHLDRVSKTPGMRFKREEGIDLPEHLDEVTPIQAENISLADIMMMSGSFRAVGEDILDIRPDLIEETIEKPGFGTGGINKATSGLQALAHQMNRETGRYHILDIGIDEMGIYATAAAMSRTFGGSGFVMCEIQFNDYDFALFAPEEISSIYQRSNGMEKLPVVVRQSYGFVRGRTIKGIFERGGAAGTYHSACHVGQIANRYKGFVVVLPNTSRAIQMAYRNAASGDTPTIILMSNPAMRSIAIGDFPYTDKYLPLDTPLDPLGTYFTYAVKGDPVGAHHHVILTYGEYAPICHYVAEKLYETGIRTLVVDYNYVVPRNENVVPEILEQYSNSSIRPKFTVVSQEGDFGFGDVILRDLMDHGQSAFKISKEERVNQWLAERLTFPTPETIFNHITSQHLDQVSRESEMVIEDVPFAHRPMAQYFAGF